MPALQRRPDRLGGEGTVLEFALLTITPAEAHFDGMTFRHPEKDAFTVLLKIQDRKSGAIREELFAYSRVSPR